MYEIQLSIGSLGYLSPLSLALVIKLHGLTTLNALICRLNFEFLSPHVITAEHLLDGSRRKTHLPVEL